MPNGDDILKPIDKAGLVAFAERGRNNPNSRDAIAIPNNNLVIIG